MNYRPHAWLTLAILLGALAFPATAQTPPTDPRLSQLTALHAAGQQQAALALADSFVAATPDDLAMLVTAARLHQEAGQIDQALVFGQRLERLAPASHGVWELLVQLYQAKGDLPKRDDALKQLLTVQRNAMDPDLRLRPFILRDRIEVPNRSILVQERFDTSDDSQAKFLFLPISEIAKPENYLIVQADPGLTNTWREAGILEPGKRVFTLASVFRKGRTAMRAVYEVYPQPPDYDRVRAKVMDILAGTAKPLSGTPGGLALPARQDGAARGTGQ